MIYLGITVYFFHSVTKNANSEMLARKKRKKTEPPSGPSSNRQLSIEPEYDNPHVVNLNPARNGKLVYFFDHRINLLKIYPEIDLT